jgi:hypothetical protein
MRRYFCYLAVALFVFGLFSLNSVQIAYGQKTKQRSFYIESQPNSPLLIRDLTATILPENKYRSLPKLEVTFYVENRSKKAIKRYAYQDPAENDKNYEDYQERGRSSTLLLPGESDFHKGGMSVEGESLVYRIKEVEFEDGTKWKAKPFIAAKAKKSAPVKAVVQPPIDNTIAKRILTREWTVPIFIDRVTKTLEGKSEVIEGITVQTKVHEIKPEYLDYVENCPPTTKEIEERDKALAERDSDVNFVEFDERVESFTTYEINGRVFAYAVPYESYDEETKDEIGIGFEKIYVDEDGSGVFKLRCDEMDLKALPQWVKELAKK